MSYFLPAWWESFLFNKNRSGYLYFKTAAKTASVSDWFVGIWGIVPLVWGWGGSGGEHTQVTRLNNPKNPLTHSTSKSWREKVGTVNVFLLILLRIIPTTMIPSHQLKPFAFPSYKEITPYGVLSSPPPPFFFFFLRSWKGLCSMGWKRSGQYPFKETSVFIHVYQRFSDRHVAIRWKVRLAIYHKVRIGYHRGGSIMPNRSAKTGCKTRRFYTSQHGHKKFFFFFFSLFLVGADQRRGGFMYTCASVICRIYNRYIVANFD